MKIKSKSFINLKVDVIMFFLESLRSVSELRKRILTNIKKRVRTGMSMLLKDFNYELNDDVISSKTSKV